MTTLVRTRIPLETLSMNHEPQRRRSKRIAAYDQNDGDFQFTRSKRKKTEPTPEEITNIESSKSIPPARPRRTSQQNGAEQTTKITRERREMSFDTPHRNQNELKVTKRGPRRSTRNSTERAQSPAWPPPARISPANDDASAIDLVGGSSSGPAVPASNEASYEATKIALPFSDTPIMNRNKDMRKKGANSSGGARRSSLGLRGRRASSLIDSGHSALPHREVDSLDFYKHIEAGLLETRRMKQALVWCAERALGDKPSLSVEDGNALMAARAINQGLLKDFATKSDLTDWFRRDEAPVPPKPEKRVVVPNPRNAENAEKVRELEENVKRLQEERDSWKQLLSAQPPLPPAIVLPLIQPLQLSQSHSQPEPQPQPQPSSSTAPLSSSSIPPSNPSSTPSIAIDATLLTAEQRAILARLTGKPGSANKNNHDPNDPDSNSNSNNNISHEYGHDGGSAAAEPANAPSSTSSPTTTTTALHALLRARLSAVGAGAELQVDRLADGVHKLARYRLACEEAAARVAARGAWALAERERREKEAVGTGKLPFVEVLRALSRVVPQGSTGAEGGGRGGGGAAGSGGGAGGGGGR